MFSIDDKDIKKLERDLITFKRRALPFATRATLNSSAFMAQRHSKRNVQRNLILRNKYTEQSIRVQQTKDLNVSRQYSIIGSIADYMEDQEFGGTKTSRGKHGVPLATSYSAGQGRGKPRTKLPRKPNKLYPTSSIRLNKKTKRFKSKRQQNIARIKQAASSGQKFVYLELNKREGIFKVTGGKKNPKIQMVWDMSRSSVPIPKEPWLKPAFDKAVLFLPRTYRKALRYQLQRHNILK